MQASQVDSPTEISLSLCLPTNQHSSFALTALENRLAKEIPNDIRARGTPLTCPGTTGGQTSLEPDYTASIDVPDIFVQYQLDTTTPGPNSIIRPATGNAHCTHRLSARVRGEPVLYHGPVMPPDTVSLGPPERALIEALDSRNGAGHCCNVDATFTYDADSDCYTITAHTVPGTGSMMTQDQDSRHYYNVPYEIHGTTVITATKESDPVLYAALEAKKAEADLSKLRA